MAKSIKFKIQEDSWTCRLMSEARFKKLHGDGQAITDFDTKTIDFSEKTFSFRTAIHELSHAYNNYLHLEDTNSLPWEDLTEILSTSNERNLLLVLEKSLKVYNKFAPSDSDKIDRELLLKLILIAQKWL